MTRRRAPKLSISERIAASAYGARAQWPAGFQLYQRGSAANGVFIVLHGHVILRSTIKGGRGFVSAVTMAGETFGAEGLALEGRYSTDASASDEVETLHMSAEQFRAFVREQPSNAIALIAQIMAERGTLLDRLQEMAAMNVEERLITSLLRLSYDRSLTTEDGSLRLDSHLQRLLCEMVGATRESITLAMSRIMGSGDGTRQGTTIVIDPSRLRERVSSTWYDTTSPLEVVREMDSRM